MSHREHNHHRHRDHDHKKKKEHKHSDTDSSSSDSDSECRNSRKNKNHCKIELICNDTNVCEKNVFGIFSSADYYAVNPENEIIPPNSEVTFLNEVVTGNDISRLSASKFKLGSVGTYQVSWNVTFVESPVMLLLNLNSSDLTYTQSNANNTVLVKTTLINSVLSLKNNGGPLTYQPNLTSHLVITKLN